ncbi:amidohydrolase family protein [bacterium]|nr:amidohydrolase family protein [bacterium]
MKKAVFLILTTLLFSCGGGDESSSNPCDPNPCLNSIPHKTVCIENGESFTCGCEDGYVGSGIACVEEMVCETPCNEWEFCNNQGWCEISAGRCYNNSQCNDGYACGDDHFCFEIPDPCDNVDCGELGTCVSNNNMTYCKCPEGYGYINGGCIEINEINGVVQCGDSQPIDNATCISDGKTTGKGVLIKGNILTEEKIYQGGEVLFSENGIILCVGCDCSSHSAATDASLLNCSGASVSPALINAHDHITYTQNYPKNWGTERYEHRHDWRKGLRGHTKISASGSATTDQQAWGELRHVMSGVTVLAGSGGAKGYLRNVDKGGTLNEGGTMSLVKYETFPLGDSNGTLLASGCGYPSIDTESVLNNGCYLPHVSEGIDVQARNEFLCLSGQQSGGKDLTKSNVAFIHAVGFKAEDGKKLADRGTAMIWSPRSNISLYGNTAPVTMFDRLGVTIGLGTDWTPSGSMNMLRELQCASYLNNYYYNHHFSYKDIWKMATISNARALHIDSAIGDLKVGLLADIAIFDARDFSDSYEAVVEADIKNVALVIRGGKPIYGDTTIMSGVPKGQTGCEALVWKGTNVCGKDKTVCVQSEISKTFAQLVTANSSAYGLFFCDTPSGEPTCTPTRQNEYTSTTATDSDADGVADDQDNCPNFFNPIRPLDNGVQADSDHDNVGDWCDECPLELGTAQNNGCPQ